MTILQDSGRGAEIRRSAFIGDGSLYFALNTIGWKRKRKGNLFKCLVVLALEHETLQLKLKINTIKSNFGF